MNILSMRIKAEYDCPNNCDLHTTGDNDMPNALVVDDDPSSRLLLSNLLERRGFSIRTAGSLAEARQNMDPPPDICMVDLQLPDGEGTELMRGGFAEQADFVVVTGHATVESSVEAMRQGAI